MNSNPSSLCSFVYLDDYACAISQWWHEYGGPSWICQKSYVCICSLQISGFAGFTVLHLSDPAICICRQVISTHLLEQRWISPKTSFVFSKSNHLHFHSDDIHICQSLLFSSLLINRNSPVQPIFTHLHLGWLPVFIWVINQYLNY